MVSVWLDNKKPLSNFPAVAVQPKGAVLPATIDSIGTEINLKLPLGLLGAMTKFNAQEGLFVAWNGFKSNVQKELASQFFRLRLWTQKELLAQIFAPYDQLDEELKAELPLSESGWWRRRAMSKKWRPDKPFSMASGRL